MYFFKKLNSFFFLRTVKKADNFYLKVVPNNEDLQNKKLIVQV